MDIKRAKQEIRDSIEAYLAKDEFGAYRIPPIRQRPILLMGPPGIGKTQIMEQIARECRIGLVAYTITHHTRQSAVGLPFIMEKQYGGRTYSVTEYTMSEIIASVYDKIEQTGIKEGILFIDEINCVSETLAPAMLQFLQGKTFGNQKVPEGWIIAAAGNPPEYNKSVRDFDVVTLDRLKKIDVEENFDVWKEYAYRQEIHPAVISYLELRKQNFYRVETTVDGKKFATARGWEDLSQFIKVYETLGKNADREVVYQYIQHEKIAKDFANYLELYYKYRADYGVEEILKGRWNRAVLQKIKAAAFDEHLSIISLLNGKLGELFIDCYLCDAYVEKLHQYLTYYKENLRTKGIEDVRRLAEKDFADLEQKELLDRQDELVMKRVIAALERFASGVKGRVFQEDAAAAGVQGGESQRDALIVGVQSGESHEDAVFEAVKEMFRKEVDIREAAIEHTSETLTHVFDFMEETFGDSQEMVALMTEPERELLQHMVYQGEWLRPVLQAQ